MTLLAIGSKVHWEMNSVFQFFLPCLGHTDTWVLKLRGKNFDPFVFDFGLNKKCFFDKNFSFYIQPRYNFNYPFVTRWRHFLFHFFIPRTLDSGSLGLIIFCSLLFLLWETMKKFGKMIAARIISFKVNLFSCISWVR